MMVLSVWEISSEFISLLLLSMIFPFSVIYLKIQVNHCAMSQTPLSPRLHLELSSPKHSLCSLPRSAAPSWRNPGIQNIWKKCMDARWLDDCNDKLNVDNDRSSSRDCLEELVEHQHQLLVCHRSLDGQLGQFDPWTIGSIFSTGCFPPPKLQILDGWKLLADNSIVNHSANDRERVSKMLRSAASHPLQSITIQYNPLQCYNPLKYTTIQ